jgi:hypothetical protein
LSDSQDPERWNVEYDDAVDRWVEEAKPNIWDARAVADWIDACQVFGPPADGVEMFDGPDDDLYAALVPQSEITITYRVIVYERLIIIRPDIGG